MTKLIFAVWGDDLATSLRDPDLHERLAAVGVRRLQVNVEDEHVAGAMRIDHLDDPIAGFVTVWDAEAEPVAEVLRTVATAVHGYAVDERRRLDPPEAWDGSRADALANVAVLRRPDELDQAEWLRRWMVDHTAVGIRTQATFGYQQNIVLDAAHPGRAPHRRHRRGALPERRASPTSTRSTAAAATTPSSAAGSTC